MTVKIVRLDLTASDLRREAARTKDADAARRMLAIALLLEGHSREDAARQCGIERQTLRDWVALLREHCAGGGLPAGRGINRSGRLLAYRSLSSDSAHCIQSLLRPVVDSGTESGRGKSPSNDGFVSIHCSLNEASPVVARTTLPAHATMPFDGCNMLIALRRAPLILPEPLSPAVE